MSGIKARHVVPSSTGRRVIFAAFERSIVIRDLVSGEQSGKIETTFDFGGRRLALSDELEAVLAAAYHRYGLALYSGSTGQELWRRRDVKKVQRITLSRDGLSAYCGIEGSSLVVIDLLSGEAIRKVRAAHSLHDSPCDRIRLLDGTRLQLLEDTGRCRFLIDRTTFAILDVAFTPSLLCLSESGGPVRCLDLGTGREVWRFEPPPGSHVLCIAYREQQPCLAGVEWPFEKGGAKTLLQLSLDDGAVLGASRLPDAIDCCFALSGTVLATTSGKSLTP